MLTLDMISSLDIHLLSAGRITTGTEWKYRQVNSFYNRLFLTVAGEAFVSHHGREYRLSPGTVHLTPCFTAHDYRCEQSVENYYITFTSRAVGNLDIFSIQEYNYEHSAGERDHSSFESLLSLNPEIALPVGNPAHALYRQYHEKQLSNYHNIEPQLHMENAAYISLLLAPFIATGKNEELRGDSQRLLKFIHYIENNLQHVITVEEIAAHLDMTPNYLSDWLARHFRFRPIEYINRRRTEEAQQQLVATKKSISEISFDVGFSSPSYFSRVFKNQTGMSASRYRSLYRNP